jgi:hypothetical protein
LELAHGRTVPVTEEEYERAMRGDRPEGSSYAFAAGEGCYRMFDPRYGAFITAAADAIAHVCLEDEQNNPRRRDISDEDMESFPKATLVFRVAERGWLAHLLPGFAWDTAMFDFHGWEGMGEP